MVAIVTGGSRGIGLSIVKELLDLNYDVIVSARTAVESFYDNFIDKKNSVHFKSCDISDAESRQDLVQFALEKFAKVDLLVNCAGVAPKQRKDMMEINENDFDYLMNINLKGSYFLTQLVANKAMIPFNSGRIINITSVSSYAVSINRAEYCIAKAGLSMVTKLFATRLAENSIGVFEISPGIIETDMTANVKEKYLHMINDGITPIKRMGQPKDVANVVKAIAQGNLDFCIGTVINADGGFSLRRL